ncbi:MAG TPA: acyltransferase family protein [Solimonas sp.]
MQKELQVGGKSPLALVYRRDIDGLRAIAILLVVLYHFGLGVPGGYVGVDVFFVISGFLITGIIEREFQQSTFSYADFYERRARRIVPALVVVLFACVFAATVLLLPSDLTKFGQSVLATVAFVSNFYFWMKGSYFGGAAELSPLLHTWSLAVEEQFYLLLPPCYLLLRRYTRISASAAFGAIILVSFLASALLVETRAQEVFYWSPFRAWELALGGWLAVARVPAIDVRWRRDVAVLSGLGLIVAAGFLLDSDSTFPGPWALLPCAGAALIIWAGSGGSSVANVLIGNRPMVFVGLISYSLYLWHWPLAAFYRHLSLDRDFTWVEGLLLMTLSFIAAILSWHFVEKPFRRRDAFPARRIWKWTFVGILLSTTAGAGMLADRGLSSRFSDRVVRLDEERSRLVYRDDCFNRTGRVSVESACRVGAAEGRPEIAIWGDSYGYAMLPAFDIALENMGVSGVFFSRSACPPLPFGEISFKGRINWRCHEFNDDVFRLLVQEEGIKFLVLAAAWDFHANPQTDHVVKAEGFAEGGESLAYLLNRVVREAGTSVGRTVGIIEQVPSYPWSVPYRMALAEVEGQPRPVFTAADNAARAAEANRAFDAIRSDTLPGVSFLKMQDVFCGNGMCRYADGDGLPYYFDNGHLNVRGAIHVAPQVESFFRTLMKKDSDLGDKK